MTESEILKLKLEAMLKMHEELSQAYHNLSNILLHNRHVPDHWRMCNEQTCANNRLALSKVIGE